MGLGIELCHCQNEFATLFLRFCSSFFLVSFIISIREKRLGKPLQILLDLNKCHPSQVHRTLNGYFFSTIGIEENVRRRLYFLMIYLIYITILSKSYGRDVGFSSCLFCSTYSSFPNEELQGAAGILNLKGLSKWVGSPDLPETKFIFVMHKHSFFPQQEITGVLLKSAPAMNLQQ